MLGPRTDVDLAGYRGNCAVLLCRGDLAAELLRGAVDAAPRARATLRAVLLNDLGAALATLNEFDLACAAFRESLDLAAETADAYLRTEVDRTQTLERILARSADPKSPDEIRVNQSDALAAQLAGRAQGLSQFLGLGAVVLLMGGVRDRERDRTLAGLVLGCVFVSMMEWRGEIGLRALSATGGHVAGQFLVESTLLSALAESVVLVLAALATTA